MKAELIPDFNTDLSIPNAARVSFNKWSNEFSEADARITKYMANAQPVPHFTTLSHGRTTFLLPYGAIDLEQLTETDLAGMIYSVDVDNSLKIRHSLYGWKTLIEKGCFDKDVAASIWLSLNSLYPESWRLICNVSSVEIGESEGVSTVDYLFTGKETDKRFIDVTFRITAHFPVVAQWAKHQVGATRNSLSRRYVDELPTFFITDEWRARPDKSIKQGSGGKHKNQWLPKTLQWLTLKLAKFTYNTLISRGYAPEQVRDNLPLFAETSWIETASLATYERILLQRLDDHAQKEIRVLAEQVKQQLIEAGYEIS